MPWDGEGGSYERTERENEFMNEGMKRRKRGK
jgi:hypothetical protein